MGEIRNSWDYQIIRPLVLGYLFDRAWPSFVSCTVIQDYLERMPELDRSRIVRMEWDIAHALNEYGYRRISAIGKGFVLSYTGIQTVPEPARFRELSAMAF